MTQQQVFSDRYEMVRHIARGGMAQVYLARDLLLDRPVALKVLFPELSVDRAFVERFRREAKAAANLSHPNIVSIYDWGQGERTYYIVMEYIDGNTLSALLRSGPLDPGQAAGIASEVAAALEFAHKRGVIHRDVKPGNVLIENGTGRTKVADFGIARAAGTTEDLTQTGSVMGTATYFSPEQAQGLPVDARSDVYSLGVVLYEMLAGRAPFAGDSPVSIAYKHVKEAPPPLSELNPQVPEAIEAIVMKAMAKDPIDRYQTADAMRGDLMRFTAGERVSAEVTRVAPAVAALGAEAGAATVAMSTDRTRLMGTGHPPTATVPAGAPLAGPPPADEPRRRTGLIALVVLLVLAVIAAGVFFGGRAAGWWDSTKTLTIPHTIVGKPEAAAMAELKTLGFSNVTAANQANAKAKGLVITSNPPPGTSAKSDAHVILVVSSGPALVTIPSTIIGEQENTAISTLEGLGLKTSSTTQSSATIATGTVLSTTPPTGTQVQPGSTVQLVVSSGKALVTIPPLTNESPTAAGQILGSLGLVPSQTSEPSAAITAGLVTRTSPPAGTQVPSGTTVIVYVSSGEPTTTTAPTTTTTTVPRTTTTTPSTTTTLLGPPTT